jgi:4-amino-4-deoxy-L-arabinose transferase-like glycosyltransferase
LDAHGATSPLYYFTSSFGNYALAFPLAFFAVLGALKQLSVQLRQINSGQNSLQPAARLLLFLLGWALVILIGLSIPHTKKIRYLLPMMPAIAAIAAYPFIDQSNRLLLWMRRIIDGIFFLLPILAGAGLWAAENFAQKHQLELPVSLPLLAALLFIMQLAIIYSTLKLRTANTRSAVNALCAAATLWILQVVLIEPAQLQLHDTQTFVRNVEQLRRQQPAPLVFFKVGKDAAAIKYLVNVDYDLRPDFYASPDDINRAKPPFYLVLDNSQRAALHDSKIDRLTPVASGRFDNDTYVAFYVNEP